MSVSLLFGVTRCGSTKCSNAASHHGMQSCIMRGCSIIGEYITQSSTAAFVCLHRQCSQKLRSAMFHLGGAHVSQHDPAWLRTQLATSYADMACCADVSCCADVACAFICRKLRMAQERKAAQESAAKQKKGKKGIMVDEGHVPTAEELRLRQMRAGRFGKGAVDHSVAVRAHAPVYAVRVVSCSVPLFTPYPHDHSTHHKPQLLFASRQQASPESLPCCRQPHLSHVSTAITPRSVACMPAGQPAIHPAAHGLALHSLLASMTVLYDCPSMLTLVASALGHH